MMRARASASATREVSIVIQRRPHCSATVAVVPEPQVGSSTRSPGSEAINMHPLDHPFVSLHHVNLFWSPLNQSHPTSLKFHELSALENSVKQDVFRCRVKAVSHRARARHAWRGPVVLNHGVLPTLPGLDCPKSPCLDTENRATADDDVLRSSWEFTGVNSLASVLRSEPARSLVSDGRVFRFQLRHSQGRCPSLSSANGKSS